MQTSCVVGFSGWADSDWYEYWRACQTPTSPIPLEICVFNFDILIFANHLQKRHSGHQAFTFDAGFFAPHATRCELPRAPAMTCDTADTITILLFIYRPYDCGIPIVVYLAACRLIKLRDSIRFGNIIVSCKLVYL